MRSSARSSRIRRPTYFGAVPRASPCDLLTFGNHIPLCLPAVQRRLKNCGATTRKCATYRALLLSVGLVLPSPADIFRNPRHIAIPSNPLQVGTADFNGDGRPDSITYTDASGSHVILGSSEGSYATPQSTPLVRRSPWARHRSCQAADFNRMASRTRFAFPPIWATCERADHG